MHAHLHVRFRQSITGGGFGDAQSLKLDALDHPPCLFRQLSEKLAKIVGAFRAVLVSLRDQIGGLVDRDVALRCPRAPQMVDELVARNRVHPWREGLDRIVGMTAGMDRQQHLLHQILRVRCASSNPPQLPPVVAAQVVAQVLEQRAMSRRVAVQAGEHQILELCLGRQHGKLVSTFKFARGSVSVTVQAAQNVCNFGRSRDMAYPVAGYAGKYSAEVAWQRVQKLLDYLSDR